MQLYIPVMVAVITGLITFLMMYIKDIYLKRKSDQIVLIKEKLELCYNPLYLKVLTKSKINSEYIINEVSPIVNKYGHLLTEETLNRYINLYKKSLEVIDNKGKTESIRTSDWETYITDPIQRKNRNEIEEKNYEIRLKALEKSEEEYKQHLTEFINIIEMEYALYRKQYSDYYNREVFISGKWSKYIKLETRK